MTELRCAQRVREHLMTYGVAYEVTEHAKTFTAQALAEAEHVSGRQVAKPVILMADDELVMAVLAAVDHVSLSRAKEELGTGDVRLATEGEFGGAFGDCELGAEPPFGSLYGVPTYIDEKLLEADELVFSAGSHVHSIRLSLNDYLMAAQPTKARLTS